jgi:hypothetical protein
MTTVPRVDAERSRCVPPDRRLLVSTESLDQRGDDLDLMPILEHRGDPEPHVRIAI